MGARERTTGPVTVSGGGVTVRKELLGELARPAIRLVLENEASERKTVRLREYVPEEYSVAAVGFNPEDGAEHWTCYNDGRAEFEREIPPATEYETKYGIDTDVVDDAGAFLTEPQLAVDDETVAVASDHGAENSDNGIEEPPHGEDRTESADDLGKSDQASETAVVESTGSAEGGTKASLDIDLPDETTAGGLGRGASGNVSPGDEGTASDSGDVIELSSPIDGPDEIRGAGGPETGSVVERLVEELERNDVDAEQRKILREQLDLGVSSVTRARLNQLSNRVEKVTAYADALEEFLDEKGTAREVIQNFEMQVSALREDVATLRDQASANATDVGRIDDETGSLAERVDELEGSLAAVLDRADDIEDSLSTTESQLEAVEGDLRKTECQVATNVETIDELDHDLSNVEKGLEDVEDEVDDVEERLAAVENDVAEIVEWRDELGETFQ